MPRYLRQLKTGAIYIETPTLAMRRDMVPYDDAHAKSRIQAIKTMLEKREPDLAAGAVESKEAAAIKATAKELSGLEAILESAEKDKERAIVEAALPDGKKLNDETPITSEEVARQLMQDRLNEDPKYKKVTGFKSRNEVEEYMLLEFGQEIDISRPFKDLKAYAVEKTANRILES